MWCQVETYPELLAEYRKYIQGRLPESPNMGGPLHTETLPYVPLLLKMNNDGLLTTVSQPGILLNSFLRTTQALTHSVRA